MGNVVALLGMRDVSVHGNGAKKMSPNALFFGKATVVGIERHIL
jgi:hypothetical protein